MCSIAKRPSSLWPPAVALKSRAGLQARPLTPCRCGSDGWRIKPRRERRRGMSPPTGRVGHLDGRQATAPAGEARKTITLAPQAACGHFRLPSCYDTIA
jgi:hypothetical protein